ncbi:MAG: hypothetical protein DHS20C18_13920 [Saprospiraceae bacterium]|nr:MAG: hypothetical protein DHS20C18_13920 [Saprospiraceae bacterium]
MSNKKAVVVPEKIHLISMNIFKANLETSDEFLDNPQKPEPAAFAFAYANNIAHNFDLGRSRYRLFFTLTAQGAEQNPLGVKVEYGIEFHFLVDNFKDFVKEGKNKEVQIEISLAATLFGMAYSTARGIVFERTRGTFFAGVILPVIDPYEALKKDKN